MTTYSLKQTSRSTYAIISNRRKVGFVNACPRGFVARIGQHCEVRPTWQAAFDAVALAALGYDSREALAAHNAAVRMRQEARYVANEMMAGNFDPLFAVLKRDGSR